MKKNYYSIRNVQFSGLKLTLCMVFTFFSLTLSNVNAQAIVNPTANTEYFIKNVYSGQYLTNSATNYAVRQVLEDGNNNQKFVFELVSGYTYKIKNVGTGLYMYRSSNGWDVKFQASTTDGWILEANGGKTIIKKDGSNHLGVDTDNQGAYWSKVWATSPLSRLQWEIIDATVLDKVQLENAITDATLLKEAAITGTDQGEFLQADYNTFAAAILAAQGVLNTATSQAQINTATTTLLADIETFKSKMIQFIPESGKYYILKHGSSDFAISRKPDTYTEIKISNDQDLVQRIKFEEVVDMPGIYNILNANGESLDQIYDNNWDLKWEVMGVGSVYTGYRFTIETVDQTFLRIKSVKSNLYIGVDNQTDGARVWSNKNSTQTWKIEEATALSTNVTNQLLNDHTILIRDNSVQISNLNNAFVKIIGLDGKIISNESSVTGFYSKTLKKGIYIISVNAQKYKVVINN